jgi:Protein of unknown function (DUF3396)
MTASPPNRLPWPLPVGELGLDGDLCIRDSGGKVICSIVLLVTLYIRQGDRPEVRRGLVEAYELYVGAAGNVLRWGMNPQTAQIEDLATSRLGDVRNWPSDAFNLFDLQMLFGGGATVAEAADPHRFIAVSRDERPRELSFVHMTFPVRWAERHSFDEFAKLAVDCCSAIGPTHGYAGLGAVGHPTGVDEVKPLFDLARRFSGLDLDAPPLHAPVLSSANRIKGVNWLTVVDNTWIDRVGGPQALAERLGREIGWHPFTAGAGGAVLQAGPTPRLGDVSKSEPMAPYRSVAKALAPTLMRDPRLLLAEGGFDYAEATAWLSRFG